MSQDRQTTTSPRSSNNMNRDLTPSPSRVRHRPPLRAATFSTKETDPLRRRSSFFSEGISETHRSFRTSTDDLLLPRVKDTSTYEDDQIETSHWHSVPLGLALLPAVGGLLFKDGSAVVTDITLLGLAAIFLNWALRLPWEWYKAAQSTVNIELPPRDTFSPIDEEADGDELGENEESPPPRTNGNTLRSQNSPYLADRDDEERLAAQQELRLHEVTALFACFVFPLLGAWLLHAIRSQLSRPSEGLVSNYNLTIFLLVAEIRPLSHMIKLVQRRTLFLQRKVNSLATHEQHVEERQDMSELNKRIEELEAHIAESAVASTNNTQTATPPDALVAKAASQASADLRKAYQPELDALNRAMRRYEKRMTITAIQVESRLQDLETRLKDVVVLAAAAQRNADRHPRSYIAILTNWVCALVVVPAQYFYYLVSLPGRLAHLTLNWLRALLRGRQAEPRDPKNVQRASGSRSRGTMNKKGKPSA